MPSAIIFDVDGTLIDTVDLHARAWQEALRRWGKDVPLDRLRGQIGKGGDQVLPPICWRATRARRWPAPAPLR